MFIFNNKIKKYKELALNHADSISKELNLYKNKDIQNIIDLFKFSVIENDYPENIFGEVIYDKHIISLNKNLSKDLKQKGKSLLFFSLLYMLSDVCIDLPDNNIYTLCLSKNSYNAIDLYSVLVYNLVYNEKVGLIYSDKIENKYLKYEE